MYRCLTDDKRIYPVMAVYGILGGCDRSKHPCVPGLHTLHSAFPWTASTTTMQCLAAVLYGVERRALTAGNVSFLVKAYTPFIIIPLLMLVDMTARSIALVGAASKVRNARTKSD